MTTWHRSFSVAGRTCIVELQALRESDGRPTFETSWWPNPPERMTPPDMQRFEQESRKARAELLQQAGGTT